MSGYARASNIKSSSKLHFAVVYLIGMIIGAALMNSFSSVETSKAIESTTKGLIIRLDDVQPRPTSHIDEKGVPITKQQLLEPFVVPNYVGFSIATFKPGQHMMPPHEHTSLHEFFYVLEGKGIIQVNGVDHHVEPGWFLHMAPFDKHGITVPEENIEDLKMAVSGVTTGEL